MDEILLILINNTPNRQNLYRAMAKECIEAAPTCSEVENKIWDVEVAKVFMLADRIKERVELMIDDINLEHVYNHFPYNYTTTDNPANERNDFVSALARHAYESTDWHSIAKSIIDDVEEIDRYKEKNS